MRCGLCREFRSGKFTVIAVMDFVCTLVELRYSLKSVRGGRLIGNVVVLMTGLARGQSAALFGPQLLGPSALSCMRDSANAS